MFDISNELSTTNLDIPEFFCPNVCFVVYILWSPKHQKTYTGYTSNLIQRYYSHNALGKKGFTPKFGPWVVIDV